jgi:signal transduction histidine kinase
MPSLAELIRSNHDRIVESWRVSAERAASARGLPKPELLNLMPVYVTELGAPGDGRGARGRQLVERHVAARMRQGFDLPEVIAEFALLGPAIVDSWAPHEAPPTSEIRDLLVHLESVAVSVADLFHAQMRDEEQALKRFSRRIAQLARADLSETPPVIEQLRAMLELVMDAMVAKSAALALFDAEGGKLSTLAGVGAACEEVERCAMTLEPSSFAGQVFAHEETTEIAELATTNLEVNGALLEAGVHALLGIRLPPQSSCVGIMYVGIEEARAFTPRELTRIEAFGATILAHLNTAQLVAQLRATVGRLDVEREMRETFVSVLAHDLRGPLSSSKIAAQMLVRDAGNIERDRDLAARIERNLERTDRMIRDLLDANRIHAGETLPLRVDACDLASVVEDTVDELSALHGPRFVTKVTERVRGHFSADEVRRALWNLATNAVKYGASGRPVTITLDRQAERARIAVHNEGVAIPASERASLFDPFMRASEAQSGRAQGWGLGLTLVRGVAEAHGGTASVTSDERGTTFTMELPLDARRPRPHHD